jgi:hypothetical protein
MFGYSYRAFVHRKKTELDVAAQTVIGYARAIMTRLVAVMCLFAVSLGLAGCTKCGWLWDEGPRSCRSDSPR